ncbi:hypothetical protein IGI04_006784 [Brassica rapa subsp. trilocularis]|uniref:Uncharacterized protein n=1 Tax=Brassica rapa subsp. trilocularis TaxID=1813537 RepID=A0ABQ7NHW9_BRACM|nr:hypothetical protein IGI04_006784 [Brassica rapa subsp. trilocularis]
MALRSKRLATLILSISNNSQVCNSGGIASIGTSFSRRISSATSSAAVVVDDKSRAYFLRVGIVDGEAGRDTGFADEFGRTGRGDRRFAFCFLRVGIADLEAGRNTAFADRRFSVGTHRSRVMRRDNQV